MTPDLEKSIIEKYPSLFANVGQKGSPMCFGLEVGDGWAGIISTMCFILQQKDTAKTFRFDQVKEKFGLLRVYHTGGNDYMAGVVRMAEDISGKTCEVCGQPGEQRKGGWIKTLCDRCYAGERQVFSQGNLTPEELEAAEAMAGLVGDRLLFSRRVEMARRAVEWCEKSGAPAIPLNIVTALGGLSRGRIGDDEGH